MPQQPNLIFIITDDQGYGDLGYQGNPWLQTPNLDQMARESVQLDNHHHDPLCSPSRAALLTGKYACRNGVWHVVHGRHLLHPEAVTMADVFAANGYRTGMFGKWHLGDNYPFAPQYRGFEQTLCHRGGGIGELPDYWGNNYIDDTYFHNGEPLKCQGYCTDVFFDAALQFIEANANVPFFVYLATNAMHSPFIVPENYSAPYRALGIPEDRANFYGMIANFDENMGRLFVRLKALGLDEDTIVVFTADHGTAGGYEPATADGFNAGLRGKKGSVYDGGHQVNFFLRWLGQLPAEQKITQLTAHIDILPTLIDLCGLRLEVPLEFDGLSLTPLISDPAMQLPERSIIVQLQTDIPQKWHHTVLLKGNWRLVNGTQLYDIQNDRAQEHDIASSCPQVVATLRQEYDRWWRGMRAAFAQSVPIPVGNQYENPALLSARDWHPTEGSVPWMQDWIDDPAYDANGYWLIDVLEPGSYKIELRSYPREAKMPLDATKASLQIGEIEQSQVIPPGECAVVFRVELRAGPTSICTSLVDASGTRQRGAYYTYVQKS